MGVSEGSGDSDSTLTRRRYRRVALPRTKRIIYREVKRALLDADVNLKVTNALLEAVKEKALGTFL